MTPELTGATKSNVQTGRVVRDHAEFEPFHHQLAAYSAVGNSFRRINLLARAAVDWPPDLGAGWFAVDHILLKVRLNFYWVDYLGSHGILLHRKMTELAKGALQ